MRRTVRRPPIPPLLRRNRSFRSFWTWQAISLVGDEITLLALPDGLQRRLQRRLRRPCRPRGVHRGSVLLNGSRAVSIAGGNGIAGLLVHWFSAPFALLVDACSYLASAFFVGRAEVGESPAQPAVESEFLNGVGVMVLDVGLGALAGGLLAAAIGLQATMWVAATGALAGVLWLLPSPLPWLRELSKTALEG